MRVMVAAFASEEPETAPKQAEAARAATASPPRKPDRITRAALKSSPESLDSEAISPIKMNSGTTDSVQEEETSNGAVPASAEAPARPAGTTLPNKATST